MPTGEGMEIRVRARRPARASEIRWALDAALMFALDYPEGHVGPRHGVIYTDAAGLRRGRRKLAALVYRTPAGALVARLEEGS